MITKSRIVLADDHSLFCDLIACVLREEFEIVGTATNGQTLIKVVESANPDVVVLDVSMPLLNGIDAAKRIRALSPATRVVFLTMNDDPAIAAHAMKAGGSAFLLKTSALSELPQAIRSALRGHRYITPSIVARLEDCDYQDRAVLTPREREVIQLLAEGRLMKEAAVVLSVSTRTVAFHKYMAMRKLGIHSSAELVRCAVSEHLV
jgi:DNA-binding NarL/FixJ family response regulator